MLNFAFIIMGDFDSGLDRAGIKNGTARIIGVRNIREACDVAIALKEEGIDCIELCGAFEKEGAEAVIKATDNEIPVGFVVHLEEQDELFDKTFNVHK